MFMEPASSLLRFTRALSVAHHVPGRIRLKLTGAAPADLSTLAGNASRFVAALSGVDGIRSVNLNPLARSCTIEYDTGKIAVSAWNELAAQEVTTGSRGLLEKLIQAANS